MNKRFTTDKASGTPSDTVWSQAHNFSNGWVILSLSSDFENLSLLGKQLFSTIEESFSSLTTLSLESFKQKVTALLESVPTSVLLSFSIGVLHEQVLYCVTQHATIALVRKNTLGTILSTKDRTFASGALQEGDTFLVISQPAKPWLSRAGTLLESQSTLDECIDDFLLYLHQEKNGSDSDCVVLLAQYGKIPVLLKPEPVLSKQTGVVSPKKKTILPVIPFPKITNPGFTKRHLILFLIVMLLTIAIGLFMQAHLPKSAIDDNLFSQAQSKYEEGKSLVNLNPVVAAQSLTDASTLLQESYEGKPLTSSDKTRITALTAQIEDLKQKALRVYTIMPSLFFDFALISKDAKATAFSFSKDTMLLLDTNKKAVYSVTTTKQADVISGNLSNPVSVAMSSDAGYVLTDRGIEKISLSKKDHEIVIPKEDAWQKPSFLALFDENLYLLDTQAGMIVKYTKEETGYLPKQDYTSTPQDFSHVLSFSIDGNIWVLFDTGDIQKYAQGAADFFSVEGLDTSLSSPRALYTDPDTTNLYILDSGNKRVVVATKDGKYVAQYKSDIAGNASSLVVSEKEKKIYLLVQDKIYAIDIQ